MSMNTEQYRFVILQLKIVQAELTAFLERGRRLAHRNMKQVALGIWIHNDFENLSDCLKWVNGSLGIGG
jgi:hypothetical protein